MFNRALGVEGTTCQKGPKKALLKGRNSMYKQQQRVYKSYTIEKREWSKWHVYDVMHNKPCLHKLPRSSKQQQH